VITREASEDTEIEGVEIPAGSDIIVGIGSANRDDAKFDDPFTFDIGRVGGNQFAFGGGGPHFCLGAFLARLEISSLFDEMAERGLGLSQQGDVERAPSNFVHGVLSVNMEPVR
jgi:cytochrome P450